LVYFLFSYYFLEKKKKEERRGTRREMPTSRIKRKIRRIGGKLSRIGGKLKRTGRAIDKKYDVMKKVKKYGPGIAAAGVTAASLAGAVALGQPWLIPAGQLAAGSIHGAASALLSNGNGNSHGGGDPSPISNRNTSSHTVSAKPTGASATHRPYAMPASMRRGRRNGRRR